MFARVLLLLLVVTFAFASKYILLLLPSLRVFARLTPALGPLPRVVGDVFPRGIGVVVGFGVR